MHSAGSRMEQASGLCSPEFYRSTLSKILYFICLPSRSFRRRLMANPLLKDKDEISD